MYETYECVIMYNFDKYWWVFVVTQIIGQSGAISSVKWIDNYPWSDLPSII
jgi:hypothetical protein